MVGTAGQTLPAFGAIPGFFNDIRQPLQLLYIRTHSLDEALQSDGELDLNLFGAGLTVVAASAELTIEFLFDGFDSLFVSFGQGIAFGKDLPILAGSFQSFRPRNGNDVCRLEDKP